MAVLFSRGRASRYSFHSEILSASKNRILKTIFSKRDEKNQCEKIKEDPSLIQYFSPNVKNAFSDSKFFQQKTDNRPTIKFSDFHKKTEVDTFYMSNSLQKEILINYKMNVLNSCLGNEELKEEVSHAFNELCRACCKTRFGIFSYSTDTNSAKWLKETLVLNREVWPILDIKNEKEINAKVREACKVNKSSNFKNNDNSFI